MTRATVAAVIIASLAARGVSAAPLLSGQTVTPLVPIAASLDQTRQKLQALLDQLTQRRLRLREVRKKEHRVLVDLEGIDRTKEEAEKRLGELSTELGRTTTRTQATATQLVVTERNLAVQRARLAGRLREIYKYGQTGYVEVLLGAGEFGELITRWHFVSAVVRADGSAIADYTEDLTRYRQLHTDLMTEQSHLRSLAAQTEARRREIMAQEQAKRAMLTRLRAERAAYERMVKELEENSRELEVLIRRSQSGPGRFGVAPRLGQFLWPARGVFTSGFGMRRHPIFGIRSMHRGQDIAASYGAPVVAAADGVVIYTGWFGGYGKIVILDHGGNVSSLYAHLSGILVTTGQAVKRGQPIGRVGSTGYSTGPHVHFEIRIDGTPIDPARR